jgi:hypothetical protein
MTTYRLGSSQGVYTPGLIKWAINGARTHADRPQMIKLIAEGWGVPRTAAEALILKKVPYAVEGETVVFVVQ